MALNYSKYIPLIEKYSKKHQTTSTYDLARILIKEERLPHTVESLRKGISNYYRDKKVSLVEEETEIYIPPSSYKEAGTFILPKKCDNILYIGDLHIPYHSIEPIRLALKYGQQNGVNTIYINGDLIDCYSISRFSKDPSMMGLKEEIELTAQFLRNLRALFPQASIYYKIGNHDERLDKYAKEKAPDLLKAGAIRSLPELLGCADLGIEIIESKQLAKAGKLFVIHGHEYGGSGSVNVARNLNVKAQDNVLTHHFHRDQEFISKPLNDKPIGAWSIGCLCGLNPDYMPFNNWLWGFAHQVIDDNGDFTLSNKKIIGGQIR